jgi:hypothetical protein
MFGFIPFRNITNVGALASCGICLALSFVYIKLDNQEQETKRRAELEEGETFRRVRNSLTASDNSIGPSNKK